MSDTNLAPAPAPSAPAPQQSEVPINEAPVSSPTPVGSQAPERPPGQQQEADKARARRESIAKAFQRGKEGADEVAGKPKAAQRPAAETRQQSAEGQGEASQPYREGGKFARDPTRLNADETAQRLGQDGQPVQPAPRAHQPLPVQAPYREPPPRLAEHAQADWHGTPESVRGEVHRMYREFGEYYQRSRADVEAMATIRPYHQLAQQHGTTLDKALGNYVGMEAKLRQDPFGGFETISRNLGLKGENGQPITFRDICWSYLNSTPEQQQMVQHRNAQTSQELRMGQLHQQVTQQQQQLAHMQYQQRYAQYRGYVDHIADKLPRFDEVADIIKNRLDLGMDIEQAYREAILLRPEDPTRATPAAQTRNPSAQTRRTSISGAPDGSSPSDGRRMASIGGTQHPTRRDSIARAFRRAGHGV
jgi:hypothetical protein